MIRGDVAIIEQKRKTRLFNLSNSTDKCPNHKNQKSYVLSALKRFHRHNYALTIVMITILIAFFGFESLNVSRHLDGAAVAYSYQPARDATEPLDSLTNEWDIASYDPHCEGPQTQGDSDLCAQWSAVAAVNEGNDLSRVNIWLGFGAIFATAIGTAFLLQTIKQGDRSLQLAREAMQIENRAYVAPDKFRAEPILADDGAITGYDIKTSWRNSGATPARNGRVNSGVFFYKGEPNWDLLSAGRLSIDGSLSTLGSNAVLTNGHILNVSDLEQHAAGRNIYHWAAIEYDDAFPETPRRRSEVCHELKFHGSFAGPEKPKISPLHRTRFNGFDDDCLLSPTTPKGGGTNDPGSVSFSPVTEEKDWLADSAPNVVGVPETKSEKRVETP